MVLLVVGCLVALAMLVAFSGVSPVAVLVESLKGAFGGSANITDTLERTTPLLLSGLGVAIGLRAGLFNIGVEGQLLMGALAAAATGIYFRELPPAIHVTLCMAAGALAGCAWAVPAGIIKVWRGGHEVITTIMLNYLARNITKYIASGPMHDPSQEVASTLDVAPAARLGAIQLGELHVSWGLVLAVLLAIFLAWWMARTVSGYELGATGANPQAAEAAGINVKRSLVWAMAASGFLAGIAGAVQVCAFEYRFYDGISPGYGFDALAVALIALANPLAVVGSALVFGSLAQGIQFAQITTNVPKEIAAVVQGIVILIAAGIGWHRFRRSD